MTSLEVPNYTQVPNCLLDNMANMSDSELRCALALVRKIIGFHKDKPEPVSYSQLMVATGLSRQGVRNGIKDAVDRGIVKHAGRGKRGINLYTLKFDKPATSQPSRLVNPVDQSSALTRTSQPSRPELVNPVDTQNKDSKEKKRKEHSEPSGSDGVDQKPKRRRSAKQLALDAMKNALADAYGLDHAKVTAGKWNEFGGAGKDMLEVGAKPEDMVPLHAHCVAKGWSDFSAYAMAKEYAAFDKKRTQVASKQIKSSTAAQATTALLYGGNHE